MPLMVEKFSSEACSKLLHISRLSRLRFALKFSFLYPFTSQQPSNLWNECKQILFLASPMLLCPKIWKCSRNILFLSGNVTINWFWGSHSDIYYIYMSSSVVWDGPIKFHRRLWGPYLPYVQGERVSQAGNLLPACLLMISFLAYFLTPKKRRHVSPKRRLTFPTLHGFISQKIKTFNYEQHVLWLIHTFCLSPTPALSLPISIKFFVELKWFRNSIEAPVLRLCDPPLCCDILRLRSGNRKDRDRFLW